jgi:hypothetical protein
MRWFGIAAVRGRDGYEPTGVESCECLYASAAGLDCRSLPLLTRVDLHALGPFLCPLDSVLSHNILRESWFPAALRDDIFLIAILWSAATYIKHEASFLHANSEVELHGTLLRRLRRSIESNHSPTDGAIAAVSCLAQVSVSAS